MYRKPLASSQYSAPAVGDVATFTGTTNLPLPPLFPILCKSTMVSPPDSKLPCKNPVMVTKPKIEVDPVTANDPEISAEPVYGNDEPPPAFKAYDAVTA